MDEGAADPASAAAGIQAAKASPHTVYRIKLSHPVDLFGEGET